MKIKKISAMILAGTLAFAAPAMTYAEDSTAAAVAEAVDMLSADETVEMLSDPSMAAQILLSVKDLVGETDITEDELRSYLDTAAAQAGVTLDDSEKDSLVELYNEFNGLDLSQDELTAQLNTVYEELKSLGVTKEDVTGIIGKVLEAVKGFLN